MLDNKQCVCTYVISKSHNFCGFSSDISNVILRDMHDDMSSNILDDRSGDSMRLVNGTSYISIGKCYIVYCSHVM